MKNNLELFPIMPEEKYLILSGDRNFLGTTNIFFIVVAIIFYALALLIEWTGLSNLMLNKFQFNPIKSAIMAFSVLIFSKMLSICMKKGFYSWLKGQGANMTYKVISWAAGIAAIIAFLLYGYIYFSTIYLEDLRANENSISASIYEKESEIEAFGNDEQNLITRFQSDIAELIEQRSTVKRKLLEEEDNSFFRLAMMLYLILISYCALVGSAILWLMIEAQVTSLSLKMKHERVELQLSRIRASHSNWRNVKSSNDSQVKEITNLLRGFNQ